MNLLIFQNSYDFFQFFFTFAKIPFLKRKKKKKSCNLVQSPEKFSCVTWNLVRKIYPKFVTLRSLFKKILSQKKIKKIHMDSKKLINSSKMKDKLSVYSLNNFLTNFLA